MTQRSDAHSARKAGGREMPVRELDLSGVVALTPPADFFDRARDLGIEFEPGEVERLGLYLGLLLEANKTVNLTAIRDPDEAWHRHILDALSLLPILAGELGEGARLADVGSGGGVPGIPLAIVLEGAIQGLRVTLIESTGKKARFLEAVIERLGLSHVRVVQARAERLGQDRANHREKYDAVIARAVGRLAIVAELTVPLARKGGLVLLVKGQRADEELAEAGVALKALLAEHVDTIATPTGRIVVLTKRSSTPRAYPRHEGEPKRRPLGG